MASNLVLLAAAALMAAAIPTARDVADAESSGATFGRLRHDAALVAEASGPTRGGNDTALFAEGEANGATFGAGHDTALASLRALPDQASAADHPANAADGAVGQA